MCGHLRAFHAVNYECRRGIGTDIKKNHLKVHQRLPRNSSVTVPRFLAQILSAAAFDRLKSKVDLILGP